MKRIRKNEVPKVVVVLGERLKDIIDDKGLRQREVAHDAGMDVENLRKYIKGQQEMKISTIFRLAEALDTTPSELLEGLETKEEGFNPSS